MTHKRESQKTRRRMLSFVLSLAMILASIGFMPISAQGAGAAPNATAVQVAAGYNHTLVRLSNGEVWAWGSNARGQLGVNNSFAAVNSAPVRVPLPTGTVTYIAAGHNSSYAIIDGRLYAWGDNTHGQLGVAPNTTPDNRRHTPTHVDGLPLNVTQVAAGVGHVIVRVGTPTTTLPSNIWIFGRNNHGQTASAATTDPILLPTQAVGAAHSIAAGANHSLAIAPAYDGSGVNSVWGVGSNNALQIARVASTTRGHYSSWGQAFSLPGYNVTMASGGNDFTLLLVGGNIYAYGGDVVDTTIGRVGRTASTLEGAERRANRGEGGHRLNNHIAGGHRSVRYISAGHHHSLAIDTSGRVLAWGSNTHGQLGSGNNSQSSQAYNFRIDQVTGNAAFNAINFTAVAAGGNHSVARGSDGSLWAWGHNASGQLGSGATANALAPIQILNSNGTWASTPAATNFTFVPVAGGYTITAFTGTVPASGAIAFPNEGPSGAPVRTIGAAVFGNHPSRANITFITFDAPSSVNTIEARAFEWMSGLRTIVIPASVQSIGANAFLNNTNLAEVHFQHPTGFDLRVGSVFADASVFAGVPTTMRLTRPVGSDATTYVPFISPVGTTRTWFASDGNIGWWTFTPATGTGPVTITGFTGPSNLTTITIPSAIGGRAVSGIGTSVLTATNAPNLQEVIIPASVHTFANHAIAGPNLTAVRLLHTDAGVIQSIPSFTFGNPDTRNSAFRIYFPDQSVGFSEPTWRGFPTQSDHGGIWEYAEWTGQGLIITGFTGSMETVRIPASIGGRPVRYIGPNFIANNTEVRELIIPSSVVFISDHAVTNAPNLEVVYLRHTNANQFTYFPEAAFTGVHPNFRLYFNMDATGFTTPTWNGFSAFPQRWAYTISGGQVTITGFYGNETVVVIPSSIQGFPVRIIATEAFVNNPNITSILVPASVNTIQVNAVFNCRNLATVILEHTNANQLPNFAAYAFVGVAPNFRILFPYDAVGFTTPAWRGYFAEPMTGEATLQYGNFEYTIRRVTLPGTGNISRDEVVITRYLGTGAVVTIPATIEGLPVAGLGDVAFFQNQIITTVNLPLTLRTIGNNTFAGATALTSITIPASVTDIGSSAFMGALSLATAQFNHMNGADVTFGANAFANTAPNFRITFLSGATGFNTPTWRGIPTVPYGQLPSPSPSPLPSPSPMPTPPSGPRSFPVRTTDIFPGVVGQPIFFRGGVGYVSLRAFALLIESCPDTEIQFNVPVAGWATVTGQHTNGSIVTLSVTSNDPRVAVTVNGVPHTESDLAGWAGPLSGRARGQLRTINEGGNIFLPFRAVSNIFGYDVDMLDNITVQFTALAG